MREVRCPLKERKKRGDTGRKKRNKKNTKKKKRKESRKGEVISRGESNSGRWNDKRKSNAMCGDARNARVHAPW